jgi:hypothetical protein
MIDKAEDMEIILKYGEPEQTKLSGLGTIKLPDNFADNALSVQEFRKHFHKGFRSMSFEGTFNADCSKIKEFSCPGKSENYSDEIKFYIQSITRSKNCIDIFCIVNDVEATITFCEPNDRIINAYCKAMWSKEPAILYLD